MDEMIQLIFGVLSGILRVYSLLIVIRIMLTWFSHVPSAKPLEILARITDPYLNWWRGKLGLRIGYIDLSPLVGILALSVVQTIFTVISQQGRISVGIILGVSLSALWSAVSFLLGFCAIILALRFIGYLINANIYRPFWRAINTIAQPIQYRISRIIFGKKIIGYKSSLISAIIILSALWLGGRFAVQMLASFLLAM